MSVRRSSTAARRILQLASLGLAGLIAGLLTGCTSASASRFLQPHNDTDWQTSSTYASATAALSSREVAHTTHAHACYGASCDVHSAANRTHSSSHRSM
jgi:hypothetical protein